MQRVNCKLENVNIFKRLRGPTFKFHVKDCSNFYRVSDRTFLYLITFVPFSSDTLRFPIKEDIINTCPYTISMQHFDDYLNCKKFTNYFANERLASVFQADNFAALKVILKLLPAGIKGKKSCSDSEAKITKITCDYIQASEGAQRKPDSDRSEKSDHSGLSGRSVM